MVKDAYIGWFLFVLGVGLVAAVVFVPSSSEYHALKGKPRVMVTLPAGYGAQDIGNRVGEALSWATTTRANFPYVLVSIQWDAFNTPLTSLLTEEFDWSANEQETFLIRGAKVLEKKHNVLSQAYVPATYSFAPDASPALVAEELVREARERHGDNLKEFLQGRTTLSARRAVDAFVNTAGATSTTLQERGTYAAISDTAPLLPDLVPLPPRDVGIREQNGRTLLVFSTTYYNKGDGELALVADPDTAGVEEDMERTVYQHVYREDDTYWRHPIGTFLWHQEHLHYHYRDFAEYILEPTSLASEREPVVGEKATYCVRDISRVTLDEESDDMPAQYRVCGKERQGVSVGWGDTYFQTYADQNLDITDLPSGMYRLSFVINPAGRLKEVTAANNTSSALLEIDKTAQRVTILSSTPEDIPMLTHVHKKQDLP